MNLIKICKSAKKSAGDLAGLSNSKRNKILEDLSKNLDERKEEIFNSSSDTETILKLYHKLGLDMLKQLNGMFAFIFHDREKNIFWWVYHYFFLKKNLY